MKIIVLLFVLTLFGAVSAPAQTNSITFNLTDNRQVITRNIERNLLLRVTKDSSVSQKDFGWLVEVFRRPYHRNSKNLIYTNKTGNTADQSQVMAWQIGNSDFPNFRRIKARNLPLIVEIALLDPHAEGETSDAKFLSGRLRISWHRR